MAVKNALSRALVAAGLMVASIAASADAPIALTFNGADQWSGSFSAAASGASSFTLDLSPLAGWNNINLTTLVSANFAGSSGYDITSVSFDGTAFTPVVNVAVPGSFGVDVWRYEGSQLSAGLHTLVVTGNLIGGTVGFTGSLSLQAQPVPEPESYALLLAGLLGVGGVVRRRARS